MADKLTRNDELTLLGVRALADRHNAALDELKAIVLEVVGVSPDDDGWASDFLYTNNVSVQKLWERTAEARKAKSAA